MDKALKQRLVGASVLIALAVVVLPMLLSGQPQNQQETRSIEVPPKPSELSFETRRFPVGEQVSGQPSVVEKDPASSPVSPPPVEEQANPASIDEVAGESASAAPQTEPQPGTAPVVEETTVPGRYLVQVASFSTTANTNRLAERLRQDGLNVMMDTIEASVGTLHRVRVGPYDDLEGANSAMSQIRTRTPDVSPRIIDLRPDESAPVTDPSDPLVRWVVQLGSFSDQKNAESLVTRLRSAGFSAFSVRVNNSIGTRYKVRVGPEIERQAAVALAADIRNRLNIDGIVMSGD